jgi:hypothetical protein
MTTALQCVNSYKPYTLAGFELGIFCSVGGLDDHYTTPHGHVCMYIYAQYGEWCSLSTIVI